MNRLLRGSASCLERWLRNNIELEHTEDDWNNSIVLYIVLVCRFFDAILNDV